MRATTRLRNLDGKELVSTEEFLAKIRAAVASRRDPDFVVIARTDARSVAGFDEAIRRANAALEAGADVAFVESPQTLEEVQMVPQRVDGPCLLNVVWGGKTPQVKLREAQLMGYGIFPWPLRWHRKIPVSGRYSFVGPKQPLPEVDGWQPIRHLG